MRGERGGSGDSGAVDTIFKALLFHTLGMEILPPACSWPLTPVSISLTAIWATHPCAVASFSMGACTNQMHLHCHWVLFFNVGQMPCSNYVLLRVLPCVCLCHHAWPCGEGPLCCERHGHKQFRVAVASHVHKTQRLSAHLALQLS